MHRLPHPDDVFVGLAIARLIRDLAPDIIHGHGAKGGLYARLPALLPGYPLPKQPLARVYTPHGGSLHYAPSSLIGRIFFAAERTMARVTDLIPFESDYARRRFIETVGTPHGLAQVIHNGLAETEFAPITPDPDAADFIFVGEMRFSKGVDTLIDAFSRLDGRLRLALVGSGRDEAAFRALADQFGVKNRTVFTPPLRGRDAFRRGRIIVAPSRQESLPYVLLEAIAARAPIVATNVGGAPEIFGAQTGRLVPPDDPAALAGAMLEMLEMSSADRDALTGRMADFVRSRFSLERMAGSVMRAYGDALRAASSESYAAPAQLRTGE